MSPPRKKFIVRMRCSENGVYRNLGERHSFTNLPAAQRFAKKINSKTDGMSLDDMKSQDFLVFAGTPEEF